MAISLVIVWAVAMIFILPSAARALGLEPGIAGAWIGTSEFADAAGFAAAEAIGHESAVQAFTLMKVVGRDMFVGEGMRCLRWHGVVEQQNPWCPQIDMKRASSI